MPESYRSQHLPSFAATPKTGTKAAHARLLIAPNDTIEPDLALAVYAWFRENVRGASVNFTLVAARSPGGEFNMAISVSHLVVLVLGITVFVLSAWGMASPGALLQMVANAMDRSYGIYLAVIMRLILGAALIIVAPVSRFPVIFEVLGWLTLIAAVGVIVIGQERIRRVIAWFARSSNSMVRVWLLFGMAFAGFLIYGVL